MAPGLPAPPPDQPPAEAPGPEPAALREPTPGQPTPDRPTPGEPTPGEPRPRELPPGEPALPYAGPGRSHAELLRQAKAKPLSPADAAHQQRAVAALFLGLLSLFGLLGLSNLQRGVYIVAFALLAGGLAVWLAITALRRARQSGTRGPRGAVAAIVLGGIGVLLSATLLGGFALFGKQVNTFSQCVSGANTITAEQACQNQFVRAVEGPGRHP